MIIPANIEKTPIIVIPTINMAVGKRGTNPVSKYVEIIGTANANAAKNKLKPKKPNRGSGRSFFINFTTTKSILSPSL